MSANVLQRPQTLFLMSTRISHIVAIFAARATRWHTTHYFACTYYTGGPLGSVCSAIKLPLCIQNNPGLAARQRSLCARLAKDLVFEPGQHRSHNREENATVFSHHSNPLGALFQLLLRGCAA